MSVVEGRLNNEIGSNSESNDTGNPRHEMSDDDTEDEISTSEGSLLSSGSESNTSSLDGDPVGISDEEMRQRETFNELIKGRKWLEIINELSNIERQKKKQTDGEQYTDTLFFVIAALTMTASEGEEACPPMTVFEKIVQVQPNILELESAAGLIPMHLLSKCKNLSLFKWMIHQNPKACLIVQHDLKSIYNSRREEDDDWDPEPDEIVPPSALHMAIEANWEEAVDYILDIIKHDKYPPITSSSETFFQLTCVKGQTPLHWACERSNEEIILKILRAFPIAASVKDEADEYFPLQSTYHRTRYICQYHRNRCLDIKVFRELLDAYPDAVSKKCNVDGFLPLHYALHYDNNDPQKIELFLDAYPEGANIRDDDGQYPLTIANQENLPSNLIEKIASLSSVDAFLNVIKDRVREWHTVLSDDSSDLDGTSGFSHSNNPDYIILAKLGRLVQTDDKLNATIMAWFTRMVNLEARHETNPYGLDENCAVTLPTPPGTCFLSFLCFASNLFHPCDFSNTMGRVSELVYWYVRAQFKKEGRKEMTLNEEKVMKVLFTALMPFSENQRQVSFLHELYSSASILTPRLTKIVLKRKDHRDWLQPCQACKQIGSKCGKQHSWLGVLQHYIPRSLLESHARLVDFHGYLPLHRLLVERPWMIQGIKAQTKKTSPTKRARSEGTEYPLAFMRQDVGVLLSLYVSSEIIPVAKVVDSKVTDDAKENDKKNSGKDVNEKSHLNNVSNNPYTGLAPFMLPAVKEQRAPCLDTTYELLQHFVAQCSLVKNSEQNNS